MEKLKECPFCGGEAKLYQSGKLFPGTEKYRGECIHRAKCFGSTMFFDTKVQAIKAWNTRPKPSPSLAEIKECIDKANDDYAESCGDKSRSDWIDFLAKRVEKRINEGKGYI